MHLRDLCGCFGRRPRPSPEAPLTIPQYSTLCDRCKALELDDVAIGGFASSGKDGQEHLELDEHDRWRRIEIDYYRHDIYPTLLNIQKSASEGCEFCALLRDSILSPEFKTALAKDEVDTSAAFPVSIKLNYTWRMDDLPDNYLCRRGLASLEARLTIEYEERIDCSYTFKFAIESTAPQHSNGGNSDTSLAAQRLCATWLRLRLNKPGYILDEGRVAWLKGEIDQFTKEHNPSPQPSFIPTRLIQVDCEVARLVQNDDILESRAGPIRYAALSYCWGNKEEALSNYKTTKSTFATRLSGFKTSETSKVFCDAIQATRALSLPYLWVDALCIIQDDIEDWERESIQMGHIYGNAHVTLFTLSSNSCTQGFLEREPPRLRIPFRSKINPLIEGAYGVRLKKIHSNWSVKTGIDGLYLEEDLKASKWGTRGWTYQEHALSKACIWFGASRIHFLCPAWSFTEGDATRFHARPHFQLDHISMRGWNAESLCWSWYDDVVGQFAGRLFTNPTDCFPALSGLAQNFHKTLGDEYLAGLWAADLHKGLWFSCVRHPTSSFSALLEQLAHPEIYIAPTWSWASRRGVTYHPWKPLYRVDRYLRCTLKDIRKGYRKIESGILLMGLDRFGRLKSGSLKVTGRVYDLQLSPDRIRKPRNFEDGELVLDSEDRTIVRCECDWAGSLTDVGSYVVLLLLGHYQDNLILPITKADELSDDNDIPENRLAYGLLIHNAPESANFYRIGIFWSTSEDGYGTALFRGCEEREIVLI